MLRPPSSVALVGSRNTASRAGGPAGAGPVALGRHRFDHRLGRHRRSGFSQDLDRSIELAELAIGFAAFGVLAGTEAFAGAADLAAFGAGAFFVDLGAVFFVGIVASLSDRGSKERASTNTVGAQEVS